VSDTEERLKVTRYWWHKAQKSMDSAHLEFSSKAYSFAINRVYYAAFYGVSALLLERRLSFKKHSGVRATFHREFIKTGLLDNKWGKFYDRLFEDRQEGDYLALIEFEHEYVKTQLDLCSQFLKKLRPLFQSHLD
jgi:uncharacterized protein (UPF0332 family)